jgi:hypothetical protein
MAQMITIIFPRKSCGTENNVLPWVVSGAWALTVLPQLQRFHIMPSQSNSLRGEEGHSHNHKRLEIQATGCRCRKTTLDDSDCRNNTFEGANQSKLS